MQAVYNLHLLKLKKKLLMCLYLHMKSIIKLNEATNAFTTRGIYFFMHVYERNTSVSHRTCSETL